MRHSVINSVDVVGGDLSNDEGDGPDAPGDEMDVDQLPVSILTDGNRDMSVSSQVNLVPKEADRGSQGHDTNPSIPSTPRATSIIPSIPGTNIDKNNLVPLSSPASNNSDLSMPPTPRAFCSISPPPDTNIDNNNSTPPSPATNTIPRVTRSNSPPAQVDDHQLNALMTRAGTKATKICKKAKGKG
ncbi:hypothetical protein FVEG_17720 [Fusarium verticillioides 7600]|uniref:Uncharacterized protein n=1 Tax=Gibberella moniliformis (strain M3125 / FGSC 7600) TaxID=334819 RepID=W7N898_GIBM7|nr:hypothetical protein FVEG_17720 [Fusarium verticillioides 7600]EWG55974.1 hypothetical protein FVEG_17720 [Fusarium verticillioides 7600]